MSARQLTLDLFESLNSGDRDRLRDLISDDATIVFPRFAPQPIFTGPSGVDTFVDWIAQHFPCLTVVIEALSVAAPGAAGEAETVVVEWSDAGRTSDGRTFENSGVTVIVVHGERISTARTYLDTVALAHSLGIAVHAG